MKENISILFLLVLTLSCGSSKNTVQSDQISNGRDTFSTQKTLTELSDQETYIDGVSMPLIGIAYNRKGGAVIECDTQTYWIDGLNSWDKEFNEKKMSVWGDVVLRNDNPVFLDTGKIVSQGIPVETEEELDSKRGRYWIINAKFEVLKP